MAAGSPVVVRYADDLLALCHSREQAEQVKARLASWLAPRGLVFNEAKTQITHLDQGVDFLGFNIRRYRGKLLTKPSKDALRRIRKRLSTEMRALRGANADAVIRTLNPIIAGWAAYYRIGVSSRAFQALDHHVWRLTYKWARLAHPNKSRRWVVTRYFGKFNPARQDRWVFGSRTTGYYLRKFAWTKIVRHQLVTGTASPDDPSLTEYWARRRRRSKPPVARPCFASRGRSMDDARYAGDCCCTPTRSHKARTNGNSGSPLSARRSANTRSVPCRERARRTIAPLFASYTPTAIDAPLTTAVRPDSCTPVSLKGLLEPVAWKAGTAGSEGAPAQQCAGATRRASGFGHPRRPAASVGTGQLGY